jgi:trehalose-phosphatase
VRESSRTTGASLPAALSLAAEALEAAPAGLLTDFDGTLSPIVTDPSRAALAAGAERALAALARRLAVVAVITGRAPDEARRLIGVPGVLIAGNHGLEWLEPGALEPVAPLAAPEAASVRSGLDEVLARLPPLPGVVPEHKGMSASVHYRLAPDPAVARAAIVDALGEVEPLGLRLGHGRMIVEVRPVGLGDKGSATRTIVERYRLRGVVAMGDDVTDLDMFAAAADLRRSGGLRVTIVAVGGADREVDPEIAAAADAVLPAPEDAARLLARLAGG